MKKQLSIILTAIYLFSAFSAISFSQEKTTIRPTLLLNYVKTNDVGSLVTKLTYAPETTEFPLIGMEIIFYTDGGKRELGKVATDANGSAVF